MLQQTNYNVSFYAMYVPDMSLYLWVLCPQRATDEMVFAIVRLEDICCQTKRVLPRHKIPAMPSLQQQLSAVPQRDTFRRQPDICSMHNTTVQ